MECFEKVSSSEDEANATEEIENEDDVSEVHGDESESTPSSANVKSKSDSFDRGYKRYSMQEKRNLGLLVLKKKGRPILLSVSNLIRVCMCHCLCACVSHCAC